VRIDKFFNQKNKSFLNSSISKAQGYKPYTTQKLYMVTNTRKTSNKIVYPVVSSVMDGVVCKDTILDPGNWTENIINEAMATLLINKGAVVETDVPFTFLDFHESTVTSDQVIEVNNLTLYFPHGPVTESLVKFYITKSDTVSAPTVILGENFLQGRLEFNYLEELDRHLAETRSESNNTTNSIERIVTESLPSDTVNCDLHITNSEVDLLGHVQYQQNSYSTDSPPILKLATSVEEESKNSLNKKLNKPTVTVNINKLLTNNKASNIVFDISTTGIIVENSEIKVEIPLPMNSSASTLTSDVGKERSCNHAYSNALRAKRSRVEGILSEYTRIYAPGLEPLGSQGQRLYFPVEVAPEREVRTTRILHNGEDPMFRFAPMLDPTGAVNPYFPEDRPGDLSHLDPSVLRHRPFKGTRLSNSEKVDDTDPTYLLSEVQQIEYRKRVLRTKLKTYAEAARMQVSRSAVSGKVNSVMVNGTDLTDIVHRALKEFAPSPLTEDDELDPTVKSNPKAFWFGTPETPEELKVFLEERIENARQNCSLTDEQVSQLKTLVTLYQPNLRTRLGNDMCAKFPPMKIRVKEGSVPKRHKVYSYPPHIRQQLDQALDELESAKLIVRNPDARWAAPVQMVPKPGGKPGELRLVIDYRWINSCTLSIQGGMPILKDELQNVIGAKYFFSADFLKGYWQVALHEDSQDYLSFITPRGIYKPVRIPQGAVDSPLYFQAQLSLIFRDLIDEKRMILWVDDVLIFATSWEEYLLLLERFFQKCKEYNLQVNVKKTTLADLKATFCGREITGEGSKLKARATETFKNMSIPEEAGDLSQFLMGLNWMRDGIPPFGDSRPVDAEQSFAAISNPLWQLLDKVYAKCGSKKKRRYQKIKLSQVGWSEVHTKAFNDLKEKLNNIIEHSFPIPGARLCLFTDASEDHYAGLLTQVVDWSNGKEVHEQKHSIIATLSGTFRNSEKNWRINEKEAYPLILALQEWEHYLLNSQGFDVYGDHRNLIHIFKPDSLFPPLSKGAKQRVYNWLYLLGHFKVNVMKHITGEDNCWADLLSRWGNPNFNSCGKILSNRKKTFPSTTKKTKRSTFDQKAILNSFLKLNYDPGQPNTSLPSREIIKIAQAELTPNEQKFFDEHKDSFKLSHDGLQLYNNKLWIPHEQIDLLTVLCIGGHCGLVPGQCEPGHRGHEVTLQYLSEYVYWKDMNEYVRKFCNSCLCCMKDKDSGDRVPRVLGSQIKAKRRGEVLSMDFMYIGKHQTSGPHNFDYILVLKDKFSGYVELVPCDSPTSANAVMALQWWIARFTKPKYLISDQGSHFTATVVNKLAKLFDVRQHFTIPYCPWSNGSVERVNRDIKALLKIMMRNTVHKQFNDWPYVLPVVMSVINSTPSSRLGNHAPKEVFLGLPKYNPFHVMYAPHVKDLEVLNLNNEDIQAQFTTFVKSLEQLHVRIEKDVLVAAKKRSQQNATYTSENLAVKQRRAKELGKRITDLKPVDLVPNFVIGDYVLVAIPEAKHPHKLQAMWRGPYQITDVHHNFLYEVTHLTSDEVSIQHVTRLKFFSNKDLDIPVSLLDEVSSEMSPQFEYVVSKICDHGYSTDDDCYKLLIQWEGFSSLENTWESIDVLLEDIPQKVREYVHSLPASDIHKPLLLELVNEKEK
jgi:hypothetical protein